MRRRRSRSTTRRANSSSVTADRAVIGALEGSTASTTDGAVVVATPITDQGESVVGVLRVTESLGDVNDSTRQAWLLMALAGLVAIGGAWIIADRLSRRLAEPIVKLSDAARRMESGGVFEAIPSTGIAEVDVLNAALVASSANTSEALMRERRFSADVSHQLRTPLAGLRLKLEADGATNMGGGNTPALEDLERLEHTVDHLLSFARDAVPLSSTCNATRTVVAATDGWKQRASAAGRLITAVVQPELAASGDDTRASATAIGQVLDVLLDNSVQHGQGTITVSVRSLAGGVAIDVADEGTIDLQLNDAELFERHRGMNLGIGLALARSITEAEGGRLVLSHREPTTFSMLLLSLA
jgi:signal transduction histidine kinase